MAKITKEEFEKMVGEGISSIPEKFLKKLENIVVVIEDRPTQKQSKKINLRGNRTLLGLYEGIPQAARGNNYTLALPDKITIFKKAIESVARNKEEIREVVKDTVWHEIAHHFGMDEGRARHAEFERRRKNI